MFGIDFRNVCSTQNMGSWCLVRSSALGAVLQMTEILQIKHTR